MSDFSIRVRETERTADLLARISTRLSEQGEYVNDISRQLDETSGMSHVRASLSRVSSAINRHSNIVRLFSTGIAEIARHYEMTENRILGIPETQQPVLTTEADVVTKEEKNWWDEFKELFDQNQENDEAWQRFLRDMFMNTIVPGSSAFTYIWEYLDDDSYMGKTVRQVVCGNFTEDSTGLGIAMSIVVGFIPGVGMLADIRDVVADIYNLTQEGATAEEWVSLALSTIGFIPLVGDFARNGDEIADAAKGIKKYLPNLGEGFQKTMKSLDDIVDKADNLTVFKKWDKLKDGFDKNVVEKIKDGVDDFMDNIPGVSTIKGVIDNILPGDYDLIDAGGDIIEECLEKICSDKTKEMVSVYFQDKNQSLQRTA